MCVDVIVCAATNFNGARKRRTVFFVEQNFRAPTIKTICRENVLLQPVAQLRCTSSVFFVAKRVFAPNFLLKLLRQSLQTSQLQPRGFHFLLQQIAEVAFPFGCACKQHPRFRARPSQICFNSGKWFCAHGRLHSQSIETQTLQGTLPNFRQYSGFAQKV